MAKPLTLIDAVTALLSIQYGKPLEANKGSDFTSKPWIERRKCVEDVLKKYISLYLKHDAQLDAMEDNEIELSVLQVFTLLHNLTDAQPAWKQLVKLSLQVEATHERL